MEPLFLGPQDIIPSRPDICEERSCVFWCGLFFLYLCFLSGSLVQNPSSLNSTVKGGFVGTHSVGSPTHPSEKTRGMNPKLGTMGQSDLKSHAVGRKCESLSESASTKISILIDIIVCFMLS